MSNNIHKEISEILSTFDRRHLSFFAKKRHWRIERIDFPHLWEISTDLNRKRKVTIGKPGPTHLFFGTQKQLFNHLDHCPMANVVCDIGSCYKNHIGGICKNILGKFRRVYRCKK